MLSAADFPHFFKEVHGHEPFPWQQRLLTHLVAQGEWPNVLDLPTGSGKTAAIDIAVFHLALEAERSEDRRAPVRIAFVVDRRLVVDDAFTRAQALAGALAAPNGDIATRVAERLRGLSGGGPPLIARRLRGGIPREDDWARTPAQPTVLCSTVDQVGSRLLFRGYGVSDSMKPVHAGLIGSDCLILLDEAHLAEPFRQTLKWVRLYRGGNWRDIDTVAPWGVALLTATPSTTSRAAFSLDEEDNAHPVLKKRLEASKPARLVALTKPKGTAEGAADREDEEERPGDDGKDVVARARAIVEQVRKAREHFALPQNGVAAPAIGVVVNRVARARDVFERLRKDYHEQIEAGEIGEPVLMIGPARPVDRDELAAALEPIRTRTWREDDRRVLAKPFIVVATQCIEAGVDIDLDALITEVAPLGCLRQRFGRLNRAGRGIVPYAAIIAFGSDLSKRADDPVYGKTIAPAWQRLKEAAVTQGKDDCVDFGLNAFAVSMASEALAPKADAPILLPAHLDLLTQTSPIPAADPEVALYLHGADRQPDSISIVWRADIEADQQSDEDVRRLLTLVPPRAAEAIELPLWAVRRWLVEQARGLSQMADVAGTAPETEDLRRADSERPKVFRWNGNTDRSRWVDPVDLRPGDTVIVPAHRGGVDAFGWSPQSQAPATDVARKAADPFAGRHFAVRVAPGLVGDAVSGAALADALAGAASARWQDLRAALTDLDLPDDLQRDLAALDRANRRRSVTAYLDLYGTNDGRPRGVVFAAPFGIAGEKREEDGRPNATEDDASGSLSAFPLSLADHSADVERQAEAFASAAGLPRERVADLKLAGFLHDAGKADPRFQRWLYAGDPLGPDPDETGAVLAKSGRLLPRAARAAAGLPEHWRHEAFSVRLAQHVARFAEAHDPELVLWLIGVHHGHGRPFFPHQDPEDAKPRRLPPVLGLPSEVPPGTGPQSLAFDWHGLDWATLFARLTARYGAWELARLEAILRLADHRASEQRVEEVAR
jgi:CRISPR-associated endonuclease/helicase Cas3